MSLWGWLWLVSASLAMAAPPGQEQTNFVYTVQPGDTLMRIALRYNLKLADLILANNLLNQNLIYPGQQLILPGGSGQPNPAPAALITLPAVTTHTVQPGETLFTIATTYGVTVEELMQANNLINPDLIQAGQTLSLSGDLLPAAESLPSPFTQITLSEPTISQGRTLVVKVKLSAPAALSGELAGRPIFFDQGALGQFWGLAAIHAMEPAASYTLTLRATWPDGPQVMVEKNITVVEGSYGYEHIQLDGEHSRLLDADLIKQEQEKLNSYWVQISPQPRWNGPFGYPVDSVRLTSYFGTRRSYNSSAETTFHGGIDFGGQVGAPVYAPAAGRVVMAHPLTIRGQAVLIDHGLGLFSGYWHLNDIAVVEGQEVQPGALIGFLGGTGLATGPHLHWEMRLNGIAVEPLQWVQQIIP